MNTRNRIKVTIKGNDKGFMGRAVVAFAKELAQAAEVSRDSSTEGRREETIASRVLDCRLAGLRGVGGDRKLVSGHSRCW